jgi:hypothetical protein
MSDESPESDTNELEYRIETELSERELLSIGAIVALWGSLEYEIFCQTLRSFSDSEISAGHLPKAMNNMQFSEVLALWETQVVGKATGKRREVLQKQYEGISYHHDFRNALVHGMWDWSVAAPEKITAIRVRKKEIRRTHFTADDLASFVSVLEAINFRVRYPGGHEDYAAAMSEQGAYLSRRAVCAMTGHPLADELFRPLLPKSEETPQE